MATPARSEGSKGATRMSLDLTAVRTVYQNAITAEQRVINEVVSACGEAITKAAADRKTFAEFYGPALVDLAKKAGLEITDTELVNRVADALKAAKFQVASERKQTDRNETTLVLTVSGWS